MNAPVLTSIEALRPRNLDEIIGQDASVGALRRIIGSSRTRKPPHLLIHGPPGVGKSSASFAFVEALTGLPANSIKSDQYWEVNAAANGRIEYIRDRVVPHLGSMGGGWDGKALTVIRFAEADHMSQDAWAALREPLEHSRYAIAILDCNDVGKIDRAIRSRCLELEFKPLSEASLNRIVEEAADRLGLPPGAYDRDAIVWQANGQARDALNLLLAHASPNPEGGADVEG